MKIPWWRTSATLLLFGLMVGAMFLFCDRAARPGVLAIAVGAEVTLGLAAAGKSAYEKAVASKAAP